MDEPSRDVLQDAGPADEAPGSRTLLWVFLLLLCFGAAVGMGWLVLREIEDLGTANSDNAQWSLAQTEVEFLQFQLAIERAGEEEVSLDTLRRRFDVFYSRIGTFASASTYSAVRSSPEFIAANEEITDFLDAAVPVIDSPDAQLAAALPALSAEAQALLPQVRALSLAGLASFAESSDERREDVRRTLAQMVGVLGLLLGGFALLTNSFRRLYRVSRRQAQAMERAGDRMRAIVEAAADAILVCDRDGAILDMNTAGVRLFGYSREEGIGRRALETIYPADVAPALQEATRAFFQEDGRAGTTALHYETEAVSRSGRRFPAEVSIARTADETDPIYVAFIRDISRRKEAEEGLTEARDKALAGERAKAEFLAVMSHEMRTPLNGLMGTMQLMRDHSLSQRQSELLDRMHSSGRLLLGLVNDVLDLAKFEAGKLKAERRPFSVSALLDGVVETTATLASSNGNSLRWRPLTPGLDIVRGDSRRLRQVLLNLVGNAVKFTRAGSIDIEVERLPGEGGLVEFRVADTGIGIAEAQLERIFQDFETLDSSYSRQAGGTGLGLGIARRLVGVMGGEIGVESEPGEGSLFWVRLSLPPAEAEETPLPGQGGNATLPVRPLDVLLVEDNEMNRFVARGLLESEGHKVTEAVDGRAGVEWAESHPFDVILMDISMPVMDGQTAARKIRAGSGRSATTPIIALTAHALPEEVERFREAGMAHCLSKPIDRKVLSGLLRGIAAGYSGGSVTMAEPASGLIDRAQLGELSQTIRPADLERLLATFRAEMDEGVTRLTASDLPPAELGALAHKCAGSCATLGLTALRQLLGRVETAAKRGEVSEGDLAQLPELWAESRQALDAWQGEQALTE
ncbi:ATP-binding protein [Pseudoroseicyclus tamaricis]|uniref:histidine kinase n=1 Tax=Pseudoroseicyclus tamaricis TaxID=2705421 RepID=A0A6B2JH48_9RHOB|nr:ATP-binding protein [Pseudoroseicyclus tamaricis]NDV00533.1 response regulator [Pseudoroseicyclus tamaricis]